MVDTLENDGVSCKEEVEQAVNEGHVDTQQKHNGFCGEQPERTTKVLGEEFAEVDLDLLLFGMDTPILRSAAEF